MCFDAEPVCVWVGVRRARGLPQHEVGPVEYPANYQCVIVE